MAEQEYLESMVNKKTEAGSRSGTERLGTLAKQMTEIIKVVQVWIQRNIFNL